MQIGSKIRKIRNDLKMTSSELAIAIGVSQSFISGIENDTKKCSLENLQLICRALGITLSDFFNDGSNAVVLSDEARELVEAVKGLDKEQLKLLTLLTKQFK